MFRRLVQTQPARTGTRTLRIAALVALACVAAPAGATQIVVTTTEDEIAADGDCSLREAFFAASSNAPRDACPAGSNTQTDDIVLAADATYALTLPFAANGLGGELDVFNGSAATDVSVTVTNGGTATISQDAVPDTRILSLRSGAKVLFADVVLQGGNVTGASVRGGAALIASGATLGLTRCVVRENGSQDSGGAIRNQGNLVIEDSIFEGNTTAGSGGAISTGSNSSTLISGTLFANNVAAGPSFASGGAIESTEEITIQGSSFVNNRASGIGGAIAHFHDVAGEATLSQSCFIGNEATATGNAVDVFLGSVALDAVGNWWGADDGPSGEGPGSGDGVSASLDFDPQQPAPHAECLPLELAGNGGFQSGTAGSAIPQRWTPTLLTAADGRACAAGGACIVKMRGNGNLKRLAHTVRHAGSAGDAFVFKARSRAKDVPATGGVYRAKLTIVHEDGSQQNVTLDFSTGKHGFERKTKVVSATEDYADLRVAVEYGKVGGVVRFDSVSLQLQPEL